MKPLAHYDETWGQQFLFFLGWTPKKMSAWMLKNMGIQDLDFNCEGKTGSFQLSDGRTLIIVWMEKKPTNPKWVSNLAHEIVHAAHMCLGSRGVHASFDNDEPMAYLVGALMAKAMR